MHRKIAPFALVLSLAALLLAPVRGQDLNAVMQKLNVAARGFKSTSATVEVQTVQTIPVLDDDAMKGTAYYQRNGNSLEIAAHFTEHNNQPTAKTYIYSGGVFRLSDSGNEKDAQVYNQASKYESYLMLGFGASGDQLADKWTMTYKGKEKVDGVDTDVLELVAKDPDIRRNIPSVTIWIDTTRAVSLKQEFDEGQGMKRTCHYTNIELNHSLPKDAFKFAK